MTTNNSLKFKKKDISERLANEIGFSTQISKKIIDDLIEIMKIEISLNRLNLKNLGSFRLINKNERMGRNPKTKKEFKIKARKSISFTASKKIIEKINYNY